MSDFTYTGAIQLETITSTGTYDITAFGAAGGTSEFAAGLVPAHGAEVSGDIYLTAGTVLEIVVGGEGADGHNSGGGGGGGSFVFTTGGGSGDIFLAVAGGGGGDGSGADGFNAQTSGNGGAGTSGHGGSAGAGGTNGAAGFGGGALGGGGGGYTGGNGGSSGPGGISGTSFAGGANFAGGGGSSGIGGFGGGGGGGSGGGGGGGGYGGGGGGTSPGIYTGGGGGGGGGSYYGDLIGASASINTLVGNGEVIITEVACFLTGTHISTPRGEVPVEDMRAGELVLTADGQAVPIRWIGVRTVSTRFVDPLRGLPIRIRAGAFAKNIPVRDLLVSPDHAMFLDGILVQAGALVNGMSITRETNMPASFTYYHVEAADHALILAEGAATETFVDNVDRMNFDNWAEHEVVHAGCPAIPELNYPRAKSARQVPALLRSKLAGRAAIAAGTTEIAA